MMMTRRSPPRTRTRVRLIQVRPTLKKRRPRSPPLIHGRLRSKTKSTITRTPQMILRVTRLISIIHGWQASVVRR